MVVFDKHGGIPTDTDGTHQLVGIEGATDGELVLAELLSLATPPSSLASLGEKILDPNGGASS